MIYFLQKKKKRWADVEKIMLAVPQSGKDMSHPADYFTSCVIGATLYAKYID